MERTVAFAVRVQMLAWIAWFAIYGLFDGWSFGSYRIMAFSATVDRIDAEWVKWVFLNVVLQLLLALAALFCSVGRKRGAKTAGLVLACVNSGLIAGHVAITIATS